VFEVISNIELGPSVHRLVISAPRVARARKPGQFVIVRKAEGSERIPLTIADANPSQGTITLIVQAVGVSTKAIVATAPGQALQDIAGPMGKPTHLEKWGKVACIGGGVGTAVLYPLVRALYEMGNTVYTVIGGRGAKQIILADELRQFSKELHITTEDGTLGREGLVTIVMEDMLSGKLSHPDAVFAVGPVPMMEAVADMTRSEGIPTIVSLNAIMIDGTGMCGCCRVTIGGEVKFTCVDGPEFDGHKVNFEELRNRLNMYRTQEQKALEEYCRLEEQIKQMKQV